MGKNPVSAHHIPATQVSNDQNKAVIFENEELKKGLIDVKPELVAVTLIRELSPHDCNKYHFNLSYVYKKKVVFWKQGSVHSQNKQPLSIRDTTHKS